MSETALPTRPPPQQAGGGQATTSSDRPIRSLSPVLERHLDSIHGRLARTQTTTHPSLIEFKDWFRSTSSSALAPPIKHNLSWPLSNYYISSSHNTYLSGNQLYGSSSTEAYTNVLLRGCRCLEIDVWDGSDDTSSVSSSDLEDGQTQGDPKHLSAEPRKSQSRFSRLKNKVREEVRTTKNRVRSRSRSYSGEATSSHHHRHNTTLGVDANSEVRSTASDTTASLKYEPRVYHGYTLVKDIPLRTVCRAIRESAFRATDLPVIVSLEVHANLEQQQVMVEILEEEWKGYLVDVSRADSYEVDTLPSPDRLRQKILIKVKWTPNSRTGESNNPLDQVESASTNDDPATAAETKKASKILEALSRLGVYTRAYSFKHFDQPEAKIPTHVFSLDEKKVKNIHPDPQHGPALFRHNRDYMMRIYPSGFRINSSNIDPTFGWRQGAQMVALNWQNLDKGMMLNEGMFAGEDGWVLKPDGYRSISLQPDTQPRRRHLDLRVTLFAGQSIPLPVGKEHFHHAHLKPYVKFQLHVDTHGPPGEGKPGASESMADLNSRYGDKNRRDSDDDTSEEARKLKRKSKTARSADPDFNVEVLEWTGVPDVVEELGFLRVKIKDDRSLGKDEFAAWACLRLDRVQNGYRLIHLLDAHGKASDGVLLVLIEKQLY